MTSGPYDLMSQPTVPQCVEMWALVEIPLSPLSYSDIEALRVPGMPAGVIAWGPVQEVIPGVQLVRSYSVEFGPLPEGEAGATIAGFAVVETVGRNLLNVRPYPSGDYPLGPWPISVVMGGEAVAARGGVISG